MSPFPYNILNDTINIKIRIKHNNNPVYKSLVVHGFSNIEGSESLGAETTSDTGTAIFKINTLNINDKNIETCLMWFTATIDGVEYTSNKTRVNFISEDEFVVDLFIINANTISTRISNFSDYTIYNANKANLDTPRDNSQYTKIERVK
jgi:hypothetical protein